MTRLLRTLAGAVLVLVVALGGVVLFRHALAEALIEAWLTSHGLADARLEVTALGLDHARIESISLGARRDAKADRLEIRYDLTALRPAAPLAAVESVTLDGLLLRLDLTGEGPPLGSLQPLLAGRGEAGGGALLVPPVELRKAQVEAETPLGRVEVALEGSLGPAPAGGFSTSLALSAQGGPGRLAGTLFAEASRDGAASGSLVIDEGSLQLASAPGQVPIAMEGLTGALAFTLEAWRPVELSGSFATAGLRHPGGAADSASLWFDATPARASAEASFAGADGKSAASLTLALEDYAAEPHITAHLTAEASAGARLLELLPPPRATAGHGGLELRLSGRLARFAAFGAAPPSPLPAPATVRPLLAWLGQGALTLETRLSLDGLALPETARGLAGSLTAQASLQQDKVSLDLSEDAQLSAAALAPHWLAAQGLPSAAVEALQEGARLTLKAAGEPATQARLTAGDDGLTLRLSGAAALALASAADAKPIALSGRGRFELAPDLTLSELDASDLSLIAEHLPLAGYRLTSLSVAGALSGSPEALAGTAEVAAAADELVAGGARITKAEARLPLAFERGADGFALSLTAPGRLAAARVLGEGYEVAKPAASLPRGELTLDLGDGSAAESAALSHEVEIAPDPFALILRGGQAPRRIDLALGPLTVTGEAEAGAPYAGTARLATGSASLDDPAFAIAGLSGTADFDASLSQVTARFAASLTSKSEPALLAPLAVTGRLRRAGPVLRLTAQAKPKGAAAEAAKLALPISARYDLSKGRGEASLAETAISFAPGGLQPRDLLPGLADLANVAGQATVTGSLALGRKGAGAGSAHLVLGGFSFRSGSNQVSDLDLDLALDRLQPPASPPGQRLTIARVESVLPIEQIEASFQLPPAEEPQVRLERLDFRLAGGAFAARDTLLVPGAARQAIAFDVSGLDLAALFEALSVEGLTGSGVLDGRIPIALEGQEVAVSGGHLESRAPGTLSYRSPSLKSSLPPDADDLALLKSPVDLAIRALANFHYDKLSLDLDKAAAGQTDLKLHVEGKNPDLLDGYPFVFNINLKGNLNPLITALRQGAKLSDEMIRRTWKMAP